MGVFLRLAWRNLWRHRRRTIISASAIAFGLVCIIFFHAFITGFNESYIENAVRVFMGHIQIHHQGFHESMNIDDYIADPQAVIKIVSQTPHLQAYTTRIKGYGLTAIRDKSSGVLILGIVPEEEAQATFIEECMVEGKYLSADSIGTIIIGKVLADNLQVKVGDSLIIITNALDRTTGRGRYTVRGIFRTNYSELDRGAVFMNIADAQALFAYDDKVSEIALLVDDSQNVPQAKRFLIEQLGQERLTQLEVLDWTEIAPQMQQMVEFMEIFLEILLVIIILATFFGIFNTMLMSILGRMREFGIMKAMGTRPSQIFRLIIYESSLLGLIALAVGAGLGYLVTVLANINGLDLAFFAEGFEAFGAITTIVYAKLTLNGFIFALVVVITTTVLVAIYPAIKAARIKPLEAIRYI